MNIYSEPVKRVCRLRILLWLVVAAILFSCTREKPVECVESPDAKNKVNKTTTIDLGKNRKEIDPNADWCRTCVMGPKGWASCQIAYAEKMGEDRAMIKERSYQNACLDAGFKKGECPAKAIMGVTCKGDPTPVGAEKTAEALQKIFLKSRETDTPEKNTASPQGGSSGENNKK